MMELFHYLNNNELKIIELVKNANYEIEENTPLCLLGDKYFGFHKKRQKRIVICTENSKKYGGYYPSKINGNIFTDRSGRHIRRAVRHEAVHVAQSCNGGQLLDIETNRNLRLSPYKTKALIGSTNLSGEYKKEYQAYTLEDKPKLIIKALRKYCL